MKKHIATLLASLVVSLTLKAQENQQVTFVKERKMPQSLYAMSCATDGERIYIAGGRNFRNQNEKSIYAYDIGVDKWLNLTSSSEFEPHSYGSAVYLAGYESILFLGGISTTSKHILLNNELKSYNTNTLNTTVLGVNPIAAKKQGAVYSEDKVYIFGGSISADKNRITKQSTLSFSSSMYEYDLTTGVMAQLPDMPEAKEIDGSVVDGVIYTFGGYGNEASKKIHSFHMSERKWTEIGSFEKPVSAYALATYKHYCILIGDYYNTDQMIVFDTKNFTWKIYEINFHGRHMSAAVLNDKLHILGGYAPDQPHYTAVDQHWSLNLKDFFKEDFSTE